jgi:hypothetical protein
VRAGLECYFNLSAASGRDLLLGKKDAGAPSTGLNLVYQEKAVSDVFKCENAFQFCVLRLLPEFMGQLFELDFRLAVAIKHGRY